MPSIRKLASKRPRLTGFTLFALLLLAVVYYLSPAQFPVVLHKFSLVILAAVVGYWLDRHAFPVETHKLVEAAQMDERNVPLAAAAFVRRAIVMGSAMIAAAVAL